MNAPSDPSLPFSNPPSGNSPAPVPRPEPSPSLPITPDTDTNKEKFLASDEDEAMDADAAAQLDSDSSELEDWKDELRRDFEAWLASIEQISETESEGESDANDAPDLYSFYQQFAAATAESRKANRRTAEAMSQWGETLARFEGGLQPLRDTAAQLAAAQPKEGEMSRAHCLLLMELLDRMHRLDRAFESIPVIKKSWWGRVDDAPWRDAWKAQHDALDILVGHLEGLLKKEGVTRIATTGQPFDPAVMMAVAAEPSAIHPPQTILEEVAAGYLRRGELLRAAQVKVTRKP